MGATGSGKSSVRFHRRSIRGCLTHVILIDQFINHVLAPSVEKAEVGHDIDSRTSDVKGMPFEIAHFKGSIIDTPGFDDTNLSDTDVLVRISNWMEKS
jgi:hypothetical protein